MTFLLASLLLTAPPTAAELRAAYNRPVADALVAYQIADAAFRDGIGHSDAADSGTVGWSESGYLRNYLSCYHASGDPYWLDKLIDHVDRLRAHQHVNARGFHAWDDASFSCGLVEVAQTAAKVTLTPTSQREMDRKRIFNVTGHTYRVELTTADKVTVRDLDTGKAVIDQAPYAGRLAFDLFSGKTWPTLADAKKAGATLPLLLEGPGEAGVWCQVSTVAPERTEFVVHDGLIAYPVADFIAAVHAWRDAPAKYRQKADDYAAWIRRDMYDKWAPFWRQNDAETGAYTFTQIRTERYPGYLLPHNQYLAMARAYLVLQGIEGLPGRADYRVKAEQMARYFKRFLRPALDGQAYVWNYWDPPADQPLKSLNVEDSGHATLDVGFVVDAADRGFVFTPEDAQRIARTYVDVMGNGDLEHPAIAGRVDGQGKKESHDTGDWTLTGAYDLRAFHLACALTGTASAYQPMALEVLARRGAITPEDRAAALKASATIADQAAVVKAGNLGFEAGYGGRPFGWGTEKWNKTGDGTFEWSTEACVGKHSLAITGTSGTPNLVAESRTFELTGPTVFTITVSYKTAGNADAAVSVIASAGGEKLYETHKLKASDAWRTETWTVTTPKVASVRLYLRNSGLGTVWYDDLKVSTRPAGAAP